MTTVETLGDDSNREACTDIPWADLTFEDVLGALNLPGTYVSFPCPACGGSMYVSAPEYDCARCKVAGDDVHSFVRHVLALDFKDATEFLMELVKDIPAGSCTPRTLGVWAYGTAENLERTVRELEGTVEFLRRSLRMLAPNEDFAILDQLAATASEYAVNQERLLVVAEEVAGYRSVSEKPRAG